MNYYLHQILYFCATNSVKCNYGSKRKEQSECSWTPKNVIPTLTIWA